MGIEIEIFVTYAYISCFGSYLRTMDLQIDLDQT